jgi:hypothetical protein
MTCRSKLLVKLPFVQITAEGSLSVFGCDFPSPACFSGSDLADESSPRSKQPREWPWRGGASIPRPFVEVDDFGPVGPIAHPTDYAAFGAL